MAMVPMHGGRRDASRGYGGCARRLTGDGTTASSDNVVNVGDWLPVRSVRQ